MNVSVLIKFFKKKTQCFLLDYHKFSIKSYVFGCVLESPQWGDSNTYPQHMILWRNIEIFHFCHFDSDPRSPFLLHVSWKSGVTFVRRCFRDVRADIDFKSRSETLRSWSSR